MSAGHVELVFVGDVLYFGNVAPGGDSRETETYLIIL
jgi:hypothetical protein